MPPDPLESLCLRRLKSRLPPTFPVGTFTLKLIDSIDNGLVYGASCDNSFPGSNHTALMIEECNTFDKGEGVNIASL